MSEYLESAPINKVLGTRPLIVETYSRFGLLGLRHYWRVKHKSNGEIMSQHRGYVRVEDRDHAVDVLWPDLEVKPVA
jgi:hypothetical protein